MSKIIIHYFTGTGNTAHAVKLINERLVNAGHQVKILQIKKDVLPPNEVFDFHIIAFPILSWSAPVLVKKYISNLPNGIGTKAAVLAVNGALMSNGELVKGYTGQALEQIESKLKRKKYEVFLTANASFPDNWTQFTNPCNDNDIKEIFPLGENEVHHFIDQFLTQNKELYRCGFGNLIWSRAIAFLFGIVGRRVLGKFFIADEHCTGCAICAKTCPVQTIKMQNKKPYWGSRCEDCNKCINVCPEKAIQVSVPVMIIQFAINVALSIWTKILILGFISKYLYINHYAQVGLSFILILANYIFLIWLLMVPIDMFLRFLSRSEVVRKFFSISYTQNFRRYKAPGFNPVKKDIL
jgi:NAD-dependent dihydropyrimidine dehydrogenase PreA subunit/menaquinone-dependent protoporphyrinogen IX oxidase